MTSKASSTCSVTLTLTAPSFLKKMVLKPRPLLLLLLSLILLVHTSSAALALGGEKAYFDTVQMTPNISHRQNVCERYDSFRNKTVDLKDALIGLELRVGMAAYYGAYFNYDPETGIDREYPGLTAIILDELARRGKFTWRNSFGITGDPADTNHTWQDLLLWSIDSYDLQIDWWAQNLDRMNLGVGFLKEWYDSSIILITKEAPEEISDEVHWWNWTRPYDNRVWLMTIFTILISGIVYQILEWYADDRQERSMWEWWQENAYMSAINFTQAYEYQPKTFSTRLFGVSMAIWALVMTATYTANLASLLVDRKPPPIVAQTMDEVAVFGNKICTWEGTWSDDYVRTNHPGATRIPKKTVLELYNGLHNGDCDFAAEAVASWNKLKALKEYNPFCDIYWVGGDRKAFEVYAGFVSKVDSGDKCTGLIRDVLDLHMHDMIEDGFLANAWDREYKRTADINCDTYRPELASVIEEQLNSDNSTVESDDNEATRRRYLLRSNQQDSIARARATSDDLRRQPQRHRQLKATKGAVGGAVAAAAAAGSSSSADATKLTLEQMIGTFAFHWALMLIALVLANVNALYVRYGKQHAKSVSAKVSKNFTGKSNDVGGERSSGRGVMGSSTKRTTEMSEEFDPSTSNRIERPQEEDLQEQLECVRQSQSDMRQSQSQMEKCQYQMQQAQLQMIQEQRKLQEQIQLLLAAQQGAAFVNPNLLHQLQASTTAIGVPDQLQGSSGNSSSKSNGFRQKYVEWDA